MLCTSLCACGTTNTVETSRIEPDNVENETISTDTHFGMFVIVKEDSLSDHSTTGVYQTIMYDPDTMVMYTFLKNRYGGAGLTVMYNADGTLKLYSPEEAEGE